MFFPFQALNTLNVSCPDTPCKTMSEASWAVTPSLSAKAQNIRQQQLEESALSQNTLVPCSDVKSSGKLPF